MKTKTDSNGNTTSSMVGRDVTIRSASNPLIEFEGRLEQIDATGVLISYRYRSHDHLTWIPHCNVTAVESRQKAVEEKKATPKAKAA